MDGRTAARPARHSRWQNIPPTGVTTERKRRPQPLEDATDCRTRPAGLPHVFSGAFADRLKSTGKYR
jgi:hypothetical protein